MCAKKDHTVVGSELGQGGVGEAEGFLITNRIAEKICWISRGTHGGCCGAVMWCVERRGERKESQMELHGA